MYAIDDVAVGDPVAERAPAFVGHVERDHEKSSKRCGPAAHAREAPVAPQSFGSDREVRRAHRERQHFRGVTRSSVGADLLGEIHAHVRVVAVAAREERKSLHVIPVQVGEQHRAAEARRRPPR